MLYRLDVTQSSMFDQNFRASSIVMSSRIAGTHSIHHGLNDFIERLRGIFRFGNSVSKRGQQVPQLQVYIDLLEGSLSAVGAVNDGQ